MTIDHIRVDIDLDTPIAKGYDEVMTIGEAIAEQAGKQAWAKLDADVKENISYRVKKISDEEIRAHVAPLVQKAIAASVQETDPFGNARGEAKTFQEVIVDEAKKMLQQRSDRYDRNNETVIQKWVRSEIEGAIKKQLAAAMREAEAEVKAAIQAQGAAMLAETIARLAR